MHNAIRGHAPNIVVTLSSSVLDEPNADRYPHAKRCQAGDLSRESNILSTWTHVLRMDNKFYAERFVIENRNVQ